MGQVADVSVTFSSPAGATPGQVVNVTVTFTNNGPSTATSVSVVVTLPNGTTQTVSVPGASLANGQSGNAVVSYTVPTNATAAQVFNATISTATGQTNTANDTASASVPVGQVAKASLSGRVWLDTNSDKAYQPNVDFVLSGWNVELLLEGKVVGNATTGVDGRYVINNQLPSSSLPATSGTYSIRFKNPAGQIVVSTPFNQATTTQLGNASTGTTTNIVTGGTVTIGDAINKVTLYPGDNTSEQNLPIDPSGIVYDSVTRKPVAGAVVTLIGPDGNPVPGSNLVQAAPTITTDASGIYQFDLLPTAPSGRYTIRVTPPQGYAATPANQGGVVAPGVAPGTSQGSIQSGGVYSPPAGSANVLVQPNATQPPVGTNGAGAVGAVGTQYFFEFNFVTNGPGRSAGVVHNHIPLDPLGSGAILVSKTGDKTVAEVADSVRYFIRIRNTTAGPIANVKLKDMLPAGFRYILGTSRLNGTTTVLADPAGGIGRALSFDVGTIAANATYELSYYVRLGAGSQQGDGINRATAEFLGIGGGLVQSNTAQFKVNVQGGVFSNDGCILGKVFVDCDGNYAQNNESGSRELGIPGVRLVMLDGTYAVTDSEGKYSMCGVKPQTHVIKVDRTTLPKGSRMLPSSNRNAGVGDSLFVDLKGGELARADFIEGSCTPEVLDQVKARRAQGAVFAPEKEIAPDLKIDNRPAEAQQQILPAPRQGEPLSPSNAPAGGTRP